MIENTSRHGSAQVLDARMTAATDEFDIVTTERAADVITGREESWEGRGFKPDDTSGGLIPSQERELSTGGGISRDETSYRQRQLSSPCGRRECYCLGDAIDGPRLGAVLERLLGGRDFRPQSAHHHRTHQRRAADRSTETRVHFRCRI